MDTIVEFTCKCGESKSWIADGKLSDEPCPCCGRMYKGVYNKKTYTIDAIEITKDEYEKRSF